MIIMGDFKAKSKSWIAIKKFIITKYNRILYNLLLILFGIGWNFKIKTKSRLNLFLILKHYCK